MDPMTGRALRRHHRDRVLARRRSILTVVYSWRMEVPTKHLRHAHINCGCMGYKDDRRREGERLDREWLRIAEGL